jgi:DNA repair exonuclease SbcCD ATPase subunit
LISSHSLFKYKFKAKNDDISAIQKELSNTKQRFYEQKTDRVNEMTELKEKLDQKTDELARIKMSAKKETQINQNFEKQIEINQKELEFLREELHTSRNSVAELQEKVVTQEELQGREVSILQVLEKRQAMRLKIL